MKVIAKLTLRQDNGDEHGVVLRETGIGPQPYVTHRFHTFHGDTVPANLSGTTDYYWGHYFEGSIKARADFEERVTHLLGNYR